MTELDRPALGHSPNELEGFDKPMIPMDGATHPGGYWPPIGASIVFRLKNDEKFKDQLLGGETIEIKGGLHDRTSTWRVLAIDDDKRRLFDYDEIDSWQIAVDNRDPYYQTNLFCFGTKRQGEQPMWPFGESEQGFRKPPVALARGDGRLWKNGMYPPIMMHCLFMALNGDTHVGETVQLRAGPKHVVETAFFASVQGKPKIFLPEEVLFWQQNVPRNNGVEHSQLR